MQTAYFVPRIQKLGHEVAVSAFYGVQGHLSEWTSPLGTTHTVYGAGQMLYGADVIGMHARHFGADLIIMLMDQWACRHDTMHGLNVACWMPVDTFPLSQLDRQTLPGRWPVAISHFGEKQLTDAGYKPLYVPHGVDTALFRPPDDRKALRQAMGVDDYFVFFMNAANKDKSGRKSFMETIEAFSMLRKRHEDVLLVLHTTESSPDGIDLREFVQLMGVTESTRFSSQYLMAAGLLTQEQLRGSYGMADCYLSPSMGEGFGITILEAAACGVPSIVTNGSSMPEVAGPAGFLVNGEEKWVIGHRAKWVHVSARQILKQMEKAYERGGPYLAKQKAARPHALGYDVERVTEEFWVPCLAALEKRLR